MKSFTESFNKNEDQAVQGKVKKCISTKKAEMLEEFCRIQAASSVQEPNTQTFPKMNGGALGLMILSSIDRTWEVKRSKKKANEFLSTKSFIDLVEKAQASCPWATIALRAIEARGKIPSEEFKALITLVEKARAECKWSKIALITIETEIDSK